MISGFKRRSQRLRFPPGLRTAGQALAAGLAGAALLLPPAPARAEGETTINMVWDEQHDRLTPTPRPAIVKHHDQTIVLKPNKQIEESWRQTDVSGRRPHMDPGGERVTEMGENNGHTVWHVIGPNHLQKIRATDNLLMKIDVDTSAAGGCALEVKYFWKRGASVQHAKIAGTDIDATFNNYHVLSQSCTIR